MSSEPEFLFSVGQLEQVQAFEARNLPLLLDSCNLVGLERAVDSVGRPEEQESVFADVIFDSFHLLDVARILSLDPILASLVVQSAVG